MDIQEEDIRPGQLKILVDEFIASGRSACTKKDFSGFVRAFDQQSPVHELLFILSTETDFVLPKSFSEELSPHWITKLAHEFQGYKKMQLIEEKTVEVVRGIDLRPRPLD